MQKNAILYLRVSTDEQADKGYSLQYQEERLTRYCALHDIFIIAKFREDHSAKTFDRPEFKRMMKFCKKHHREVDILLFICVFRTIVYHLSATKFTTHSA